MLASSIQAASNTPIGFCLHELNEERTHVLDGDLTVKLQTRHARIISRGCDVSPRHQSGLEDDIVKITIKVTT
ncbi:hypothetical protein KCU98_g71, partial [Aureobasidium melanogenum]